MKRSMKKIWAEGMHTRDLSQGGLMGMPAAASCSPCGGGLRGGGESRHGHFKGFVGRGVGWVGVIEGDSESMIPQDCCLVSEHRLTPPPNTHHVYARTPAIAL
jgi:hypothetical protein